MTRPVGCRVMDEPTDALKAVFARWALRTHAPGIAWGLVRDGALVATGGVGTLRVGEDAPPDLDGEPDGLDALPPALLGKLAGLALV